MRIASRRSSLLQSYSSYCSDGVILTRSFYLLRCSSVVCAAVPLSRPFASPILDASRLAYKSGHPPVQNYPYLARANARANVYQERKCERIAPAGIRSIYKSQVFLPSCRLNHRTEARERRRKLEIADLTSWTGVEIRKGREHVLTPPSRTEEWWNILVGILLRKICGNSRTSSDRILRRLLERERERERDETENCIKRFHENSWPREVLSVEGKVLNGGC